MLNLFSIVIAIELGETYSRVAVTFKNKHEVIFNSDGQIATPNYVAYTDKGILVGSAAQKQVLSNVKNTIFDIRCVLLHE